MPDQATPTTPVVCYHCGNPDTIPPDPHRPEEHGHYCERCGHVTADDGVTGLL